MKWSGALASFFTAWFALSCMGGAVAAEQQPLNAQPLNVLVIVVDDLGWADWAGGGSEFYETPNLDRLAAQGMTFTNAYAASPVCSPSRAALLTGRYPPRTGVTEITQTHDRRQPENWTANTKLLPAPYTNYLPLEEQTLAELLKEQGYATFFAGKWHLGQEGYWAEDQGFDINKGGYVWGHPHGGNHYFSPYDNPRLENGPAGEHLPDRLASETIAFMQQHRAEPFLAYLSFYSVHTPLMAPEDLVEKYRQKRQAIERDTKRFGEIDGQRWRQVQDHAVFAAMVEAMDQAVGRVLDELERTGLADHTLVVFTSDNGGLATGGKSPTSNLPLRAGKGWLYEGGVRVPMIVRWPGVTPAGSRSDTVVSGIDVLPSVLAAAGLEQAIPDNVDGVDLTPVFRGEAMSRGPIFWHYPHYSADTPSAAVRDGPWKLIEWYEDGEIKLFNLGDDLGETRNVSDQHPETTARLLGQLTAWRQDVGAKMPTRREPARE